MNDSFYLLLLPSPTSVGAILLFLDGGAPCPCESSFSLSLAAPPASLFTPLTELAALLGVWGGVAIASWTPVTAPEFAAAMLGMLPASNGGLLMTVPVLANEAWVATEEVELDRVGEDGRIAPAVMGGGDGATGFDGVRWWPPGKGDGGAIPDVGVGVGVFCDGSL